MVKGEIGFEWNERLDRSRNGRFWSAFHAKMFSTVLNENNEERAMFYDLQTAVPPSTWLLMMSSHVQSSTGCRIENDYFIFLNFTHHIRLKPSFYIYIYTHNIIYLEHISIIIIEKLISNICVIYQQNYHNIPWRLFFFPLTPFLQLFHLYFYTCYWEFLLCSH